MDQLAYLESTLKSANFEHCKKSTVPIREADAKKIEVAIQLADHDDFKSVAADDREWYQSGVGKLMYVANTYRADLLCRSAYCQRTCTTRRRYT